MPATSAPGLLPALPRIAGRGWPGSPVRWRRPAAGSPRPRPKTAGSRDGGRGPPRAAEREAEAAAAAAELERLDAAEVELDAAHAAAEAALEAARSRGRRLLPSASAAAEQERVQRAWPRRDAWALSLERDDGTAAILADPPPACSARRPTCSRSTAGAEAAIAAALGQRWSTGWRSTAPAAAAALEAAAGASARVSVLVGASRRRAAPRRRASGRRRVGR